MSSNERRLKFEQMRVSVLSISFVVISVVLVISVALTAAEFRSSKDVQVIEGVQGKGSDGAWEITADLGMIKPECLFSVVFLDFVTGDSTVSPFQIDTDVTCTRANDGNNKIYFQTNSTGSSGSYRIFSTDYAYYDFFVVRVQIRGDVDTIASASIRVVQATPEFGRTIAKVVTVLWAVSGIATVVFTVAVVVFCGVNMEFEHVASICVLALCCYVNLPEWIVPRSANVWLHGIDNAMTGCLGAANLVVLLCAIYKLTGGNDLSVVLVVASLYVAAEAMAVLTDDSCFIARHFSGNNAAWMFFLVTAILSRCAISSYILLMVWRLLVHGRERRKALVVGYALLIAMIVWAMVAEVVVFLVEYCGNPALDFFIEHVMQTLIALALADFHWPCTPEMHTLPSSIDFDQNDLHFSFDAMSGELAPDVVTSESD